MEALFRTRGRLIPAHAGKTTDQATPRNTDRAHPRSRGENSMRGDKIAGTFGSSPLTRGKPRHAEIRSSVGRLIPAHAGKTGQESGPESRPWAHPRSRGENMAVAGLAAAGGGSSPLTRGKPVPSATKQRSPGLIPAHAGKTSMKRVRSRCFAAHPRSRGENSEKTAGGAGNRGSSPLTRGKLPESTR